MTTANNRSFSAVKLCREPNHLLLDESKVLYSIYSIYSIKYIVKGGAFGKKQQLLQVSGIFQQTIASPSHLCPAVQENKATQVLLWNMDPFCMQIKILQK